MEGKPGACRRIGTHRRRRARAGAGGRVQYRESRSRCRTCGAPSTGCCRPRIRVLSAEEVHAGLSSALRRHGQNLRIPHRCAAKSVALSSGRTCTIIRTLWTKTAWCECRPSVRGRARFHGLRRVATTATPRARSKVRTIFSSVLERGGEPPDLPRARQRLPEAHGAEYRRHPDRSRPREFADVRTLPANAVRPRRPKACSWSASNTETSTRRAAPAPALARRHPRLDRRVQIVRQPQIQRALLPAGRCPHERIGLAVVEKIAVCGTIAASSATATWTSQWTVSPGITRPSAPVERNGQRNLRHEAGARSHCCAP